MKEVFEKEITVDTWDKHYYHPIANWLYDHAVADMLRYMQIGKDQQILDAGCGTGVHSIRAAKAEVSDRIKFFKKDITNIDFPDELSEIQRRFKGIPRKILLILNNLAYRYRFPSRIGVTNLLVFEKNKLYY